MSKIIRMTQAYADECRKEFEESLKSAKMADGKISFTKTFNAGENKATVFFTIEAWTKTLMLLNEFSKEVAWHGVAHRSEDEEKNEYIISDIMVYPQEVTGTNVEMDTEEYAKWIQENAEDERFYNIHMQAHSHVNMAPNPSVVDLSHQEEILDQLGADDFYIFMIYNKSLKRNIKIYDLKKNILFEDADVDVQLCGGVEGLDTFIKNAKSIVKEKPYKSYTPAYAGSRAANTTVVASGEKPKTKIGAGWMGRDADGYYGYDPYGVFSTMD